MSVLDKFLDVMKLNDEDDFDEDDFYDDDDYDERPAKKKLFRKTNTEEEEYEAPSRKDDKKARPKAVKSNSKIMPMRQSGKRQGNGMEVCVIKPTSVEDSREITETLLNNRTVVLNLEGLDVDIAQRIIDFTSGACFAITGNLQKVSNYIFLITPPNVDISGDFQDILNGAFDVSALHMEY